MKRQVFPAICGVALVGFAGCQGLVRPTTGRDAAAAAGVSDAIPFKQPAPAPTMLSLPEAVRRAVQTDPGVRAALAKVRVAEAESVQTRLLPNPILTLTFRFPEGGQPIADVTLAAEFLSLLKKPGHVRAADFRLCSASGEVVVSVLEVLAAVREKCAAVQALEALMPVLQERQRLLDQTLGIAEARLNVQEGTRLDLTTLQAQREELQMEILEQESERRQ